MLSKSSDDSLLEVIPARQRTGEQVAHWRSKHTTPTYKLRRQPKTVCELELYGPKIAVWMDNQTLVQVCQKENHPAYQRMNKHLRFTYSLHNPTRSTTIVISGKTDDAIADTAMFWWSLYCPEEYSPYMEITNHSNQFDMGAIKTEHLIALFANNQKRRLGLRSLALNAVQWAFLATRNYPIDLTFGLDVDLENGGDAFVNALQTRNSQFGSLHWLGHLSRRNRYIGQLVQLNLFENLTLPALGGDMALLPFSSSTKRLKYTIDSTQVLVADIQTLDLAVEELIITIKVDDWVDQMEFIVSFLSQLSHFDHLKRLELNFYNDFGGVVRSVSAQRILKELVRTIKANQELEFLNLEMRRVFEEHYLKDLLEACSDHQGLRSIKIEVDLDDFDFFDYPWFKRLLARNRRIEVRGTWMEYMADEQDIDDLYSFNRFYNGSGSLTQVAPSERTTLVGAAMIETASRNFQRSALLMASYTDSLCDFIQSANMDSLTEICMSSLISDSLLEAIPVYRLARVQVARWRGKHKTPTYKLRRQPKTLDELESYGPRIAIWTSNKTLVQISRNENYPDLKHLKIWLRLTYRLDNPKGTKTIIISGNSDNAIADTAMVWWSLHCPQGCKSSIEIDNPFNTFEFGVVRIKHLATIFTTNQNRRVTLNRVTLNAAQSVFLATRNYPIDLTFGYDVNLIDGGDSFVNALQTRKSQFGSLCIGDDIPLRERNMKRLLQLQSLTKLTLPALGGDMALLPFASFVETLEYKIDSTQILVEDIQSLDFVSKKLILTIIGEAWTDGIDVVESLLGRLASFDHFKHIGLKFDFHFGGNTGSDFAQRILDEVVRTITANQELESLELEVDHVFLECHVKDLLESCGNHKRLRDIKIEIDPDKSDYFDYPWFKRLLSRNRRIEVCGTWIRFTTVEKEIDELYSFNRFCSGSESLREISQSSRTTLIGTAPTEKASRDFPRSALLMASYTDSLCVWIQSASMDSPAA